jgi:putative FmdB family regulatory protein
MPIFEYACLDCDHRFETLVRAATTPECPACHGSRLQKQLSVFAVASRDGSGPMTRDAGPCTTCGDPRGPGACSMN